MLLIISFRLLTILVVLFRGEIWRGMCVKRCLYSLQKTTISSEFFGAFSWYIGTMNCVASC